MLNASCVYAIKRDNVKKSLYKVKLIQSNEMDTRDSPKLWPNNLSKPLQRCINFSQKNCENFPEKLNSNLSGKKNIESAYKETGRLYFNELINLGH